MIRALFQWKWYATTTHYTRKENAVRYRTRSHEVEAFRPPIDPWPPWALECRRLESYNPGALWSEGGKWRFRKTDGSVDDLNVDDWIVNDMGVLSVMGHEQFHKKYEMVS